MNAATGIDPGNGAAAGSDLDDIDDGELQRLAAGITANIIIFVDSSLAIPKHGCLGRGAAHIEADALIKA